MEEDKNTTDHPRFFTKLARHKRLIIIGGAIFVILLGCIYYFTNRAGTAKQKETQASSQTQQSKKSTASNEPVKWAFNEGKHEYFVQSGTAPACKEPFKLDYTPVDLSKVLAVGMPGAYRGYSYKPHGGFRLIDATGGKVEVKMPIDAKLVGLTRYYEGTPAELQYLLTFVNDCGMAFRFDHIYTLTPALQAIAETTPEPKVNDTRSDPNIAFTPVPLKAGETIATEVGFPRIKNYGFDFGVYDQRSRNEISRNKQWADIHKMYTSTEWFARCWIDMLPGEDAAKAKQLAFVVINPTRPNIISDLCTYAPHNTLDFNGGQPTDG